MENIYPDNVTFYNFTAREPANGHCDFQQFGYLGNIAELGSTICGIMTALQGIFGLITSNNVSVGSRYVFSLLFGYGCMSASNTATLWNGFDKSADAILNLMQAIIIVRLATTLKFPPFNNTPHFQLVSAILMCTLGVYPIIANVLGSSTDNPWISWLTFDLIWIILVLPIAVTIFIYRKHYPQYPDCPQVFSLTFNAIVTCIAAYIFWLVDTFECSRAVAILQFYGLWLFFMGLTFYYLTVLDIFLQSYWQGFKANVTRWPKKYVILLIYISWEHMEAEHGQSGTVVPLSETNETTL